MSNPVVLESIDQHNTYHILRDNNRGVRGGGGRTCCLQVGSSCAVSNCSQRLL